ncbi:hypothetical protein EMO89_00255 [Bifidobacterium tissieri]|uniref:Uncharacterized protein n=1 Tax=Bifidobacterium tissieri TaxID=1630162 RepID=A0A5M9ZWK6_9BIFI|nr:hypothetical protein [Bifidobacterium tissieri]KAA8831996.1 hypothetical protein EMO89_00255 [Bifidobacterium tissieri]
MSRLGWASDRLRGRRVTMITARRFGAFMLGVAMLIGCGAAAWGTVENSAAWGVDEPSNGTVQRTVGMTAKQGDATTMAKVRVAARQSEEKRIADETAELKAGLEQANAQAEANHQARQAQARENAEKAKLEQAQSQSQAQAQEKQKQAQPQTQVQQAQAQTQTQTQAQPAPAPAPAPSGPVDHPIARVCGPVSQPADCQGAIDQGGLVQSNYYPFGYQSLGLHTIFAAHNNRGGAWILNVNVGDVISIGGVRYRATNRQTVMSGGYADVITSMILLQTCDWSGGTAQLITLERL